MSPEKKKNNKGLRIAIIVLAVVIVGGGTVFALMMKGGGGDWPEIAEPQRNPLTGEIVGQLPARPFIVSTDNAEGARPQSGLSQADIVYEFPVEGGYSRLEPIYYSETPEQVGPVRSARPYFIDMAREYHAVFVHHGWSPAAKAYLESGVIPYISAFSEGKAFYRTSSKAAPHNSYIKGETIQQLIHERGWDKETGTREFAFLGKGETPAGASAVSVDVNYRLSKNHYSYDQETGLYTKTVNGAQYIDEGTGKDITTTNILVQYVTSKVLDAKGRLEIDMTAGGKAVLFTGGVAVEGSWSRDSLDDQTKFTDKDGNEMKLGTGVTWIQVVDGTVEVTYK